MPQIIAAIVVSMHRWGRKNKEAKNDSELKRVFWVYFNLK